MVLKAGTKIAVTDEDKEKQRQRIIKAALVLFGRFGYEKTTISQIAQEADMGRGTLYWYFQNKEDLFRHILRTVFTDMIVPPLQAILEQKSRLEDKLRFLIGSWLEAAVSQQELVRIFYSVFSQSEGKFSKEMLEILHVMYVKGISALEAIYRQAMDEGQIREADAHRLARLTIGLVDGLVLQHMFAEPVQPGKMTDVIIKLMLKGLIPEGAGAHPEQDQPAGEGGAI